MADRMRSPALCRALVGREAELDILLRALTSTRQGTAQAILLAGEAGIGKSRLVREAKTAAAEQGFLILQGNSFQPDTTCPYAPLLDLLHAHFARRGSENSSAMLAPFARELARLVPDLVSASDGMAPPTALQPEQEKRRLFAALADFFLVRSAEQPLLLVFEDLHWSDETSLEVLHYLIRRGAAHPIMLVGTYRSDEMGSALRHWLSHLERDRLVRELVLTPLNQPHIDAMLRDMLDLDRPVRQEFLDPVCALVEGNPFFLEEMLRSLIATGDVYYADGRWDRKPIDELRIPRSVRDAVQLRLERLSPVGRRVLELAAVAGRRFDFAVLLAVSNLNEAELLATIKELVAAQLVVEESSDLFVFRHPLTRQAIYAGLLARERQTLHRAIADAVEHIYALSPETHLGDLATHFYEAGVWASAFEYAQRAGMKARALFAPRATVEHLTRALQAASHLEHVVDAELHRARGHAYELLGQFEHARADYETALANARNLGEARAQWQALMDLGMLWTGRDYAQTEGYYEQAFALATELKDSRLRAHSLNRVGNWRSNAELSVEALTYHEEALAIFEELGDQHGIADTLDLLGMASLMATDLDRSTASYNRSIALYRTLGDRQGLASSLAARTFAVPSYQLDMAVPVAMTLPEAAADAELAVKIARDIGHRAGESFALWVLVICLGPQGEYGRALQAADVAIQIADEIEHRQWMSAARCAKGALYTDLLALPQAHETLVQALRLARDSGSLHWLHVATGHLAFACIAQGRLDETQTLLDQVLSQDTPMRTIGQRLLWSAQMALHLARGEPQAALELADALLAVAPNRDTGPPIPRLARLRGEALLALRRLPEAEAELLAALDTATKYGARACWRIHIALSKVYLAQRRPDQATQASASAHEIIETVAESIPQSTLRATLLSGATELLPKLAPITSRRAAKQAFDGLTTREREVATLIVHGQSNHAIAGKLVVSERTIETHVSNILLKLGFASRAQIAAWAVEKGLAQPSAQP